MPSALPSSQATWPSLIYGTFILYNTSHHISVFFSTVGEVSGTTTFCSIVPVSFHSLHKARTFSKDLCWALRPRLRVRPANRTVVGPVRMSVLQSQNLVITAGACLLGPPLPDPGCSRPTVVDTHFMCVVRLFCQCSPLPESRIQKMDTGGSSAGGGHDAIFRNERIL